MVQKTIHTLQKLREEIAHLRVEIAKLEATSTVYDAEVEQEIRALEAGALALATQAARWNASKTATRSRDMRSWLGSPLLGAGKTN